ncbi:hypothetical protein NSS79_18210 [Paenibacillus sp. FSL L8-0436]|uniref:hypothetical protein n=1 Tax=Paenibacillus sp. FSL L8-0436 TaxID=2954686 RepID=UPI0031585AD0
MRVNQGVEVQTRCIKVNMYLTKKDFNFIVFNKKDEIDPIIFSLKVSKMRLNLLLTFIASIIGFNYI